MLCTIRVTSLICRPHTRYPTTRRHKRPSPRQQGLAAPAAPPCWPAGHPAQPPSPPEAAAPAKQRAPAQCSEPVPAGRRRLRPGAQPACRLQPGAPRTAAAARCGRKSKGRRRKCRLEKSLLRTGSDWPIVCLRHAHAAAGWRRQRSTCCCKAFRQGGPALSGQPAVMSPAPEPQQAVPALAVARVGGSHLRSGPLPRMCRLLQAEWNNSRQEHFSCLWPAAMQLVEQLKCNKSTGG